jgi:hypothetical protein
MEQGATMNALGPLVAVVLVSGLLWTALALCAPLLGVH